MLAPFDPPAERKLKGALLGLGSHPAVEDHLYGHLGCRSRRDRRQRRHKRIAPRLHVGRIYPYMGLLCLGRKMARICAFL